MFILFSIVRLTTLFVLAAAKGKFVWQAAAPGHFCMQSVGWCISNILSQRNTMIFAMHLFAAQMG